VCHMKGVNVLLSDKSKAVSIDSLIFCLLILLVDLYSSGSSLK
jgi:hypothetical protein